MPFSQRLSSLPIHRCRLIYRAFFGGQGVNRTLDTRIFSSIESCLLVSDVLSRLHFFICQFRLRPPNSDCVRLEDRRPTPWLSNWLSKKDAHKAGSRRSVIGSRPHSARSSGAACALVIAACPFSQRSGAPKARRRALRPNPGSQCSILAIRIACLQCEVMQLEAARFRLRAPFCHFNLDGHFERGDGKPNAPLFLEC
jgi:hypothetical protein